MSLERISGTAVWMLRRATKILYERNTSVGRVAQSV
jgi:hypothetical protein